MAICKPCERDMIHSDGCGVTIVSINGKEYNRIRAGDIRDYTPDMPKGGRCRDCSAMKGHCHHWNCANELCPVCRGQLFCCECEDVELQIIQFIVRK